MVIMWRKIQAVSNQLQSVLESLFCGHGGGSEETFICHHNSCPLRTIQLFSGDTRPFTGWSVGTKIRTCCDQFSNHFAAEIIHIFGFHNNNSCTEYSWGFCLSYSNLCLSINSAEDVVRILGDVRWTTTGSIPLTSYKNCQSGSADRMNGRELDCKLPQGPYLIERWFRKSLINIF